MTRNRRFYFKRLTECCIQRYQPFEDLVCAITADASPLVSVGAGMNVNIDVTAPVAADIVLGSLPNDVLSTDNNLSITVGGNDIVSYQYKVVAQGASCAGGGYNGSWISVATPITEAIGADGNYKICIIGQDSTGNIQLESDAAFYEWTKVGEIFAVSQNPAEENETSRGMTIDNQNRILIWGFINKTGEDRDAAVWRLNIDGTLDTSFGTNGRIVWDSPAVGLNDEIDTVKVKSDDSLLLGGTSRNSSNETEALLGKFDANGQPDTAFDPDGFKVVDIDNTKVLYIVNGAFDDNDRLLATGYFIGEGNHDAGLVRITASGTVDTSFGTNGYFQWNLDESPVFGEELQSNGSSIMFYSGNIYLSVWSTKNMWQFSGAILELSLDGTLERVIADIPCAPIPVKGKGGFASENGYIYFGGSTGRVDPLNPVWSACVAKVDHSTFTLDSFFGTNGVQASNLFPTYQGNDARVSIGVRNGDVYISHGLIKMKQAH